jgi:hypothetical protein
MCININFNFIIVWDHANAGSHTPHRMFVIVLERAAVSSWYGQDQDHRCTGRNEERCCTGLNEERCSLYWAAIGPVRLGGRDMTRSRNRLAGARSFSLHVGRLVLTRSLSKYHRWIH